MLRNVVVVDVLFFAVDDGKLESESGRAVLASWCCYESGWRSHGKSRGL